MEWLKNIFGSGGKSVAEHEREIESANEKLAILNARQADKLGDAYRQRVAANYYTEANGFGDAQPGDSSIRETVDVGAEFSRDALAGNLKDSINDVAGGVGGFAWKSLPWWLIALIVGALAIWGWSKWKELSR